MFLLYWMWHRTSPTASQQDLEAREFRMWLPEQIPVLQVRAGMAFPRPGLEVAGKTYQDK